MYEASRQMTSYYNAFQKFYRIENSNQLSRLPGCYGIQQCLYIIHVILCIDFDHGSRTVQREDTAFTLNFVHSVYVAGAGSGTS